MFFNTSSAPEGLLPIFFSILRLPPPLFTLMPSSTSPVSPLSPSVSLVQTSHGGCCCDKAKKKKKWEKTGSGKRGGDVAPIVTPSA